MRSALLPPLGLLVALRPRECEREGDLDAASRSPPRPLRLSRSPSLCTDRLRSDLLDAGESERGVMERRCTEREREREREREGERDFSLGCAEGEGWDSGRDRPGDGAGEGIARYTRVSETRGTCIQRNRKVNKRLGSCCRV